MLHTTTAELRACILNADPHPHPNTPNAATCLHRFHRTPRRDQAAVAACVHRSLAQRQHPAPQAWLLEAALYRLCCALSHTPSHTQCAHTALTTLARLASAYNRLGYTWEITRVDARCATLQARTHISRGLYTPRVSPHPVAALEHTPPTLELRWRPRGIAWLYSAAQSGARGGLLTPDPNGAINPLPMIGALLGWDTDRDPAQTRAVLRWESAGRPQAAAHALRRITHAHGSSWCEALAPTDAHPCA